MGCLEERAEPLAPQLPFFPQSPTTFVIPSQVFFLSLTWIRSPMPKHGLWGQVQPQARLAGGSEAPPGPGFIKLLFPTGETMATASPRPRAALGARAGTGPRGHPGGGITVPSHRGWCAGERGRHSREGLGCGQAAAPHRYRPQWLYPREGSPLLDSAPFLCLCV